jgi:regulator of G-protein signaling
LGKHEKAPHLILISNIQIYCANRKEVSMKRVKRWGFSLRELLKDPAGREQFEKFLDKEFSGENLKYVLLCEAKD